MAVNMRKEASQKALCEKFKNFGMTDVAAQECTAVSIIYEALFELTCHDTATAAALTVAVCNGLIATE